jgi:membrane-bound inhibitor of C-type lysozyme
MMDTKMLRPAIEFFALPLRRAVMLCSLLAVLIMPARPADLAIHLPGTVPFSRQTIRYTCDSVGPQIGVPSGPFDVEYIEGGGNALAILPISGNALIFANVSSASGARYTAQQYTWWEAKGSATLYSDSLTGKLVSSCSRVKRWVGER